LIILTAKRTKNFAGRRRKNKSGVKNISRRNKNMEQEKKQNQENQTDDLEIKSAEEAKKKSEEIEKKIAAIQEMLKDVDTNVLSEEAQELLDKISALRKEKRRIEELIAKKKTEGLKEIIFEKGKSLGLNEEDCQKVFEALKDSDLSIEDTDKIEAEIKRIVPALKPEEYWQMKEQLAKQAEMVNKNVQQNVNAGSPETEPVEEKYSEEVLEYARQYNLDPERAKKILERFSKPTRKIM